MIKRILLVVAIAVAVVGCDDEPVPQVHTPLTYDVHGLKFQYPSNWTVSEDEPDGSIRLITIDSGATMYMSIWLENSKEAETLAEHVADNVDDEGIPMLTTSKINTVGKSVQSGAYQTITATTDEKYAYILSINFTGIYGRRDIGDTAILTTLYLDTEDLATVKPGYDQILTSLAYKPVLTPTKTK